MAKGSRDPGFFGWLGRQVGHVKKAATSPAAPSKSAAPRSASARQSPRPSSGAPAGPAAPDPPAGPAVLYRKGKVEEHPMPDQPGIILRRTTIDEVVVDPKAAPPAERD